VLAVTLGLPMFRWQRRISETVIPAPSLLGIILKHSGCLIQLTLIFEISDEASSGARGAPAPPTAAGSVEFLVLSF